MVHDKVESWGVSNARKAAHMQVQLQDGKEIQKDNLGEGESYVFKSRL